MLFFGHVGLTLGAAAAVDYLYSRRKQPGGSVQTEVQENVQAGVRTPRFSIMSKYVDLRILLVGSLLPDIIDKPLGIYILSNVLGNGRIFSHTLLFLLLVGVIGSLVFWRWRRTWGLVLAFGTLMHLLFDSMWNNPPTLFWPFFGETFQKQNPATWIEGMLNGLRTKPSFYVPEIIGGTVVLIFLITVLERKSLKALIKKGKVL